MKKIVIENTKPEHLDSLIAIVESSDFIVPNNKMIYYLCCTVFSRYSLVASLNNIPIGFIFSMPNHDEGYIWIHQIAVSPDYNVSGVGTALFNTFEKRISSTTKFFSVKCAIKQDNLLSQKFFSKMGFKNIAFDKDISMYIYEKKLKL